MDIYEIRKRVQAIRDAAGDPGAAHGLEDELYVDVLYAIERDGDGAAYEWAWEALKAQAVDFDRWCA